MVRSVASSLLASAVVVAGFAVSASLASAQTGPVAAYAFDEGVGPTASDASGNNNTGTLTSATWVAGGKFGGALSFDGTSSWVTVNNSPTISLTTGMTIEAWIKTSTPTNWRCVVLKERTGALSYGLYGGDLNGRAAAYIRTTKDVDATAASGIPTNVWVHVATTYDGAALRTYVNGTQVASTAASGSLATSTLPLRIGGNSIWGEHFEGLIDEVRIYNRALTVAQIQTDMNTPVGGNQPPPITYSISGAISPAAGGNGATLTVTPGGTTTTADGNGNYIVNGLPNGTYSVAPTKTGFTMNPSSQLVTINGASVSGVNFTATSTSAGPEVVGQWGSSFDIGMVAVNMVMMYTGKVLMFSGSYAASWVERVWDPATGAITLVPNPFYNLFCAGQAQLPDGRILVAGGYDTRSIGAANANIFDPATQSWSALPNMAYRRWYPTVTALPDGRMLITSGAQSCLSCLADVPEIFDPATGRFTQVTAARLPIWYYPFMFVLPNGKVLSAGSNEQAYETRTFDLSSNTWTMVDPVIKDGHSAVMYRPGKILKTGTATDSGNTGNALNTAYVIDMTQPSPAWRQVAPMNFPRAFQNSTVLPDGNVLVTGGGTTLDGYDPANGVLTAEMWSPTTETWQTLSKASIARLYHSTALLLPDARVLIAGSGNDSTAPNQTRAELYSPPYLFKGARPTITSAPTMIQYGNAFTVQTPDAASIASVALIRPGSVTHAFDEDQRFVNLSFTAGSNSLTIQAPANANLAPPGYYMLFLVNSNGVPSIASFVRFPSPAMDTQPPTPPANLQGQGGLGSMSLTWDPSTDNVGVTLYNVHRSTTSGFVPSAANRIAQQTTNAYSAAGVPPGTYYFLVTAQDVTGNVSAPSNEAPVTVLADTTPPSVAITAPADTSTVSGSITLSATANDNVGVAGVQFQLDGVSLGAERTTSPYTLSWNSTSVGNGPHTIGAVARDAAGNRTTVTVSITVSNTVQVPTGLVAAYGFNEGAGLQAGDTSGFGNVGSVNGAVWSTSGHTGGALSFDGASASVTIADSTSLHLTNGMTIEAWVRPTAGSGWRCVVLKERTNALAYALYSANGASRPGGWISSASSDYSVLGTAAVALNTWTHLTVTYDGSAFRFYTNGTLVRTTTGVQSIVSSTGNLKIGGNSVWGEFFQGLIDDVRIYNRALTAAEIQTDMNTGVQ